ncbi:glycogen debranching protein GlgX [Raineyella sp. W15-4]|uniref:glycogen debranching protein GlgX n=1 Tax=Raineyella sp. W15-4 TaxID=3081651 RepID=UPI002955AA58|nr:glycogen debranching protein GlgX [Raineyella sp. W15-4]WOQ17410.1 glycogen debranching protein GlgX [Raineyella sp. W15-4]
MLLHPPYFVAPGDRFPLGASFDGFGTNFAIFSEVAEAVDLCLFDPDGAETKIRMTEVDGYIWHIRLSGLGPGTRYGYRIDGPWDPARGLWCNPAKLLADPYAKMFDGAVVDHPALSAYDPERPDYPDLRDSAPYTMRGIVVSDGFDWRDDSPPQTPYEESVIYETHVKGLTMRHPAIRPTIRGTYLGVAHPATVSHLHRIGVTAVELLPVHQSVTEPWVFRRSLTNYWGYNTFGFFAPHRAYGASATPEGVVGEFKTMVRELHEAGIEVILDVVFNHTAEGGTDGPTYSLRGIDNPAYYRLDPADRRRYVDTTGVGNSINSHHPMSLRLVMDSLRYWVTQMHVDGFRFDLAPTLARQEDAVDHLSAFFALVAQDPVLGQVKLIAEPWDVGPAGYQVGAFPPQWSEWNGQYRDVVRDFWRGEPALVDDFVARISGSRDIYASTGRQPVASVNFVTAHDGFTLRDVVSYERKHNDANGEHNRDGNDDNRSANYGAEGETDDPEILATRACQQRNLLATLLCSQGVPMLLGGDERGRTQGGNNNAYCHDSELTWQEWVRDDAVAEDLEAFTERCARLRREHPVFRRRYYERDASSLPRGPGAEPGDVVFLRIDGVEMTEADRDAAFVRSFGLFLNGRGLTWLDSWGRPSADDSFLLWFNAWDQAVLVTLPSRRLGAHWGGMLDTTHARGESAVTYAAGDSFLLAGRSMLVLRCTDLDEVQRLSDEVGRVSPVEIER